MFELRAQSKTITDILMYGSISAWSKVNADDFTKALKKAEDDGYSQANLRINSGGGSIFEGLAMISQMKSSPLKIHAYIDGLAASMASVIAINADKVIMAKGARMMIHQGSGGAIGSAKVLKNYASMLESLNETMAEMYAEKTGKDKEWILDNWMSEGNDEWLNAKNAEKAGLVDEVIKTPVKSPEDADASFIEMAAHYESQLNETKNTMNRDKLINQLGLQAEATDEQIESAIAKLQEAANGAAEGASDVKTVEAFMKLGKKSGLINEKNEASYQALAEKDLGACIDLLNESSTDGNVGNDQPRMSELIEAIKGAGSGKPEAKTWDQMSAEDKAALEESDPEAFEKLFKAQYGNVPNGGAE